MKFDRPHLTIDEQIELLSQRGLIIEDNDSAINFLSNISYYRLTAYAYHFREKSNGSYVFRDGTTFNKVLKLYFFDRELRLLIFDMIERIEIAMRTRMSYHYSLTDRWWYENPDNFQDKKLHASDLEKIKHEIERSREPFIRNYKSKFHDPKQPPSWMAVEVFSMGLLSKIYSNLVSSRTKNDIAKEFQLHRPFILESWMQTLTYMRNICAHHCRVWDRTLTVTPRLPERTYNQWLNNKSVDSRRLYFFLSCGLYLLKVINPETHFIPKFIDLVTKSGVDLNIMGFPEGWEQEPLWS